ncbi:MAG: SDR family oxidoreductase [Pirellulales bacterium]|nr:SDR family oxidoreductase [Pirellulales bacterium]
MITDLSEIAQKSEIASNPVSSRFSGKIVLITGASDRGIGGAIAERLASEGAAIAMLSRHEGKRINKRLGRLHCQSLWTKCDITRADEVAQAVDRTIERFGRIDVLVNNSGVEYAKPFEKFTDDEWQGLLDVNLHGAIRVSRAVLPHFPASGGAIVNVASALGIGGCSSFSIYSAAKAGLIGLTQSLACELAPRKIRVTVIAPALVATPMTLKHMEHLTKEVHAQLEAIHLLGVGVPHDISGAVAFLASDDARWVTGVTLPLGWSPQFSLPVEQFMMRSANPLPSKPR